MNGEQKSAYPAFYIPFRIFFFRSGICFQHRKKLYTQCFFWLSTKLHSLSKSSIGSYKMHPFCEPNSWFVALKPDFLCRISGTDKFLHYTEKKVKTEIIPMDYEIISNTEWKRNIYNDRMENCDYCWYELYTNDVRIKRFSGFWRFTEHTNFYPFALFLSNSLSFSVMSVCLCLCKCVWYYIFDAVVSPESMSSL